MHLSKSSIDSRPPRTGRGKDFPHTALDPTLIRSGYCCAAAVLIVLLAGCGPFAFTLNQQPVYTPPPLFSDYQIDDRNLHNCVQQTIADRKIRSAEGLTRLECTYAGIESLDGLEVFFGLQQLNLAHNQLTDIKALQGLTKLERLKLTGNPQLPCDDLSALASPHVAAELPKHCL